MRTAPLGRIARRTPFHFGVFGLVVLGALALVFAVQTAPLPIDPFEPGQANERAALDGLAAIGIAQLKFDHARAVPRYDVGLFGNSRALEISGPSIGAKPGTFFNFAISGSSFRQSVALLEALKRAGRVPRLVVVSLDHLELQLYANPAFPGAPERWGLALDDVAFAVVAPGISLTDRVRILWRHALNEWTLLLETFNAERLRNRLVALWRAPGPTAPPPYRADGSRRDTSPIPTTALGIQPSSRRMFIPAMFERDLARLAAVQRGDVRMIVYESPLEPRSARHYAEAPTAHARALRKLFLDRCATLGLECHAAPVLGDTPQAARWHDTTHPPESVLAPYIAALVERGAARVGRAE